MEDNIKLQMCFFAIVTRDCVGYCNSFETRGWLHLADFSNQSKIVTHTLS